jgi:hypothetical protein
VSEESLQWITWSSTSGQRQLHLTGEPVKLTLNWRYSNISCAAPGKSPRRTHAPGTSAVIPDPK